MKQFETENCSTDTHEAQLLLMLQNEPCCSKQGFVEHNIVK